METDTFVFDGTEVKKTGRKAHKKVPVVGGKERILELIEITPFDSEAAEWKKWVRPEELFEIQKD
jgi:hypothetical protein